MKARVLIISPDDGFGELIEQVLVEESDQQVVRVQEGITALKEAQKGPFHLAILDCETGDVPPAELATALIDWHPSIRLILIPPNNDPSHESLEGVPSHAFLTKPFYLPDLLRIVDAVLEGENTPETEPAKPPLAPAPPVSDKEDDPPPYPWLEDVDRAAQYLVSLTMEIAAVAAILVRAGKLWAFAGELGEPDGNELAELVGRQWDAESQNDFARFVNMQNGREYMLYATNLVDDLVLGLLFEAQTPFSRMRAQSGQLARALTRDPREKQAVDDENQPDTSSPTPAFTQPASAAPLEPQRTAENQEKENLNAAGVEALELEAVEAQPLPLDWLPDHIPDTWGLLEEVEDSIKPFSIPPDWKPNPDLASGPRSYLEDLLREPGGNPLDEKSANAGLDPKPARSVFDEEPLYPPAETMAETRPTRVPPEEGAKKLEPESPSFFSITYACVLLPRIPEHHLVSDLARQLEEWMVQICISFDWRLEQLAIRPDYMQWMVRVHSATAPRFLMQIITRLTSQRIFERFPHFTESNPSGEFWSPGWLVITSDRPPPPQMVQEFIQKTRRRQGVEE